MFSFYKVILEQKDSNLRMTGVPPHAQSTDEATAPCTPHLNTSPKPYAKTERRELEAYQVLDAASDLLVPVVGGVSEAIRHAMRLMCL